MFGSVRLYLHGVSYGKEKSGSYYFSKTKNNTAEFFISHCIILSNHALDTELHM